MTPPCTRAIGVPNLTGRGISLEMQAVLPIMHDAPRNAGCARVPHHRLTTGSHQRVRLSSASLTIMFSILLGSCGLRR
eukprot:6301788-Prymnesium_polylepis.1